MISCLRFEIVHFSCSWLILLVLGAVMACGTPTTTRLPVFSVTNELGRAITGIRKKPCGDLEFAFVPIEDLRLGVGPARVPASRARDFEALIERREVSLASGKRVGATINGSAVWVETGAGIWFYESIQIDAVATEPRIGILVDCQDPGRREIKRLRPVSADGPGQGSISGISIAGDPADENQAISHDLVRSLVTDLAERFAGRRS